MFPLMNLIPLTVLQLFGSNETKADVKVTLCGQSFVGLVYVQYKLWLYF